MKAKSRADIFPRLGTFLLSELPSLFIWACVGAFCAALVHLCLADYNFSLFLGSQYADHAKHFDAPKTYLVYGVTIATALLIILLFRVPALVTRGVKSWWAGVTSGLRSICLK